jgi:hypothetical protein
MTAHAQKASFHHSPAIVHITLSSVKFCLSLNKIDCFCVLGNETLLQSCKVLHSQKQWCHTKVNCSLKFDLSKPNIILRTSFPNRHNSCFHVQINCVIQPEAILWACALSTMQCVFITVVTTVIVTITQPVWLNTDVCLLTFEMVYWAGCVSWTAIMSFIRSNIVLTVIYTIADLEVCRKIRCVSMLQNWDNN